MVSRPYVLSPASPTSRLSFLVALFLTLWFTVTAAFAFAPLVGGDDAIIVQDLSGNVGDPELVKTSDGKLFCALSNIIYTPTIERTTTIYRSLDNGTTWELWSTLPKASGERTAQLRFLLAEGTQSRLHMLYVVTFADGSNSIIRHAWTNPNSSTPVWTVTTPFALSGYEFNDGDLASDVSSYGDYYLYAVATGTPASNQQNLYFARSTDKGDSWEASYALTFDSVASPDYYLNPHIAFGGNDRVQLAFDYGDNCLGPSCIHNSARTMYAANYANSGLSDW